MKKLVVLFIIMVSIMCFKIGQADVRSDKVDKLEGSFFRPAGSITFGCYPYFLELTNGGYDVNWKVILVKDNFGDNIFVKISTEIYGSIIYEGEEVPFKGKTNEMWITAGSKDKFIYTLVAGTKGHIQFNAYVSVTVKDDGEPIVSIENLMAQCNQ